MRRPPALLRLLPLLLASACTEPSKPAPVLDERHVITVDGTTVRYNGKLLDWKGTVKQWEEVLGPASRVVPIDYHRLFVWDDLGVSVRRDTAGTVPIELGILFMRQAPPGMEPLELWPHSTFRGRLVVDGGLIHDDGHDGWTPWHIGKKGKRFKRGYLPSVYDYSVDDFYFRIDLAQDGTVQDFSISLDPEDPAPKKALNP